MFGREVRATENVTPWAHGPLYVRPALWVSCLMGFDSFVSAPQRLRTHAGAGISGGRRRGVGRSVVNPSARARAAAPMTPPHSRLVVHAEGWARARGSVLNPAAAGGTRSRRLMAEACGPTGPCAGAPALSAAF